MATFTAKLWYATLAALALVEKCQGFVTPNAIKQQAQDLRLPTTTASSVQQALGYSLPPKFRLRAETSDDDDDEEVKSENPYADPNYPDLEFVNYDDPEYKVDQGVGDEFFDSSTLSTEEQIEEMREERRKKNDEFQFETYYRDVLKSGEEYKGEWTIYKTSTFIPEMEDDPSGIPRFAMAGKPLKVITKGDRITLDDNEGDVALDAERLLHVETLYVDPDEDERSPEIQKLEEDIVSTKYCPEQLSAFDFRGQQGIMCVGHGYTVCTATPLLEDKDKASHEGPFSEYFAELGIQSDILRFRIKLDYAVRDEDEVLLPPLHLRSMAVCRETLGMWPRNEKYTSAAESKTGEALFGPPGAAGGLYDPPPVGSEEQSSQYMMLELEGGATILFPYLMDQDPDKYPDSGWVTSLDWTPESIRFQLDRKVNGGKDILGLRTLELSEVQSADADTYRPKDGGQNMRQ